MLVWRWGRAEPSSRKTQQTSSSSERQPQQSHWCHLMSVNENHNISYAAWYPILHKKVLIYLLYYVLWRHQVFSLCCRVVYSKKSFNMIRWGHIKIKNTKMFPLYNPESLWCDFKKCPHVLLRSYFITFLLSGLTLSPFSFPLVLLRNISFLLIHKY